MTLNTIIQGWSNEHDRAIKDVIRVTAVKFYEFFRERFPKDVLMVGQNWLYIAGISYINGEEVPVNERMSLDFNNAFWINPKAAYRTREYTPLVRILKDFNEYLGNEFAYFPLLKEQNDEIKKLGTETQFHDDWYKLHSDDGKIITIFPLIPKVKALYFRESKEGTWVLLF